MNPSSNIDPNAVQTFSDLAPQWWDPEGPNQLLHQLNPIRLDYLKRQIQSRALTQPPALAPLRILDIGCGGGIFSESLAQLGAQVTGIDASEDLIAVAKMHQLESALSIEYHAITAESFAEQHPASFDIVTCMEMLEHVPAPESILQAISTLLKPNGYALLSTIDRTPWSFLTTIVAAEYVLKALPKGTHHYAQFIRPGELTRALRAANLTPLDIQGVGYDPLQKKFNESSKTHLNYMVLAQKSPLPLQL